MTAGPMVMLATLEGLQESTVAFDKVRAEL